MGHTMPVQAVRFAGEAVFVVAICAEIMTMPGLLGVAAGAAIHVKEAHQIERSC